MSVEWELRGGNVTETGETVEAVSFRIAFTEAMVSEKYSFSGSRFPKNEEARITSRGSGYVLFPQM